MSPKSPPTPEPTDVGRFERLARRFPQLDASAIATCLNMLHVAQDLADAYEAHFTRHRLSQGRFVVLIHLLRAEEEERGLCPAELAGLSRCRRATMTGLLDTLEKDGLVTRRDHPEDRRMCTVHLTPRGHAQLEAMLPDHFRRIAALMAPLGQAERTTLRQLLAKVSSGLPALRDP